MSDKERLIESTLIAQVITELSRFPSGDPEGVLLVGFADDLANSIRAAQGRAGLVTPGELARPEQRDFELMRIAKDRGIIRRETEEVDGVHFLTHGDYSVVTVQTYQPSVVANPRTKQKARPARIRMYVGMARRLATDKNNPHVAYDVAFMDALRRGTK